MLVQYYYKKNFIQHPCTPLQPAFSSQLSPGSRLSPFPLSPRLWPATNDREESKKDAGGSKRPYEATFWIAMKGGRRFASTAA